MKNPLSKQIKSAGIYIRKLFNSKRDAYTMFARTTTMMNGRVYDNEAMQNAIAEYAKKVKAGKAFGYLGEVNHNADPAYQIDGIKLADDTQNIIIDMHILDTPTGKELQNLMKADVILSAGSRGFGTINPVTNQVEDYKIDAFSISPPFDQDDTPFNTKNK